MEFLKKDINSDNSENLGDLFKWEEYSVFASVLAISFGIGIFFGLRNKNKTTEEFLMAGRSMSIFPVSMSLICSFVSAITLLGTPTEVYYYGTVYIYFASCFIPMTFALAFIYVPVYFNLRLSSAFEYFEMRFSKRFRTIISITAVIHLLLYMPLTVYGPTLALEQVANINAFMSSGIIFVVCIIYSSIGGLRTVLWTDAFQALVMLGSLITLIAVGIKEVGGIDIVWDISEAFGRINFSDFDIDPRTRHTFWTGLIGGLFNWIPLFAATQAQIQRYNALPTLRKAQMSLIFNMLGLTTIVILCSLAGLVVFSKYYTCDPIQEGKVKTADQLLPYFVMDVLGSYKGLPGIFVAGLTAGSLSSVSSSLNSLSAIVTYDFIKIKRPHFSDSKLALSSKIITLIGGGISFALIFVIAASGDILPFASLLHGTFLGPIFGVFTLGLCFPFANEIGSLIGVFCSLILTLFLMVGSIIAENAENLPDQRLPFLENGCNLEFENNQFFKFNSSISNFDILKNSANDKNWKNEEYSDLHNFLAISHIWQPMVPCVATIIFGLIFSLISIKIKGSKMVKKVEQKLLTPPLVCLWKKVLSEDTLNKWIEFETKNEKEKI